MFSSFYLPSLNGRFWNAMEERMKYTFWTLRYEEYGIKNGSTTKKIGYYGKMHLMEYGRITDTSKILHKTYLLEMCQRLMYKKYQSELSVRHYNRRLSSSKVVPIHTLQYFHNRNRMISNLRF